MKRELRPAFDHPRRRTRGQAIIEIAIVFPLLMVLIMGIVEYGKFLETQQTIITVVRSGARFASLNSTSATPAPWSAANPAPMNTIEGVMQAEALPLNLQNTDAQITIAYYDNTGSANPPICGQYSQSSGKFVAVSPTYTQATCVISGHLIKVTIVYPFTPVTPVFSAFHFNANLTESFWMVLEQ